MTDLLERPDAAAPDDEPRPEPGSATTPAHWLLGALLAGAGAIHVAMAPSHLGESLVEGTGFVVAAWAQLGLAALVVLRPHRRWVGASAVVDVALVAAWLVSRTVGLPFGEHSGHAATVALVDGACVALEVLAVLVAVAVLVGRASPVVRTPLVGVVASVAALGLATAAVASPSAREHASASHGAHGGGHAHGEDAAGGHAHGAEPADDLGFAELSNGHQHEHTTDEPLTADERVQLARQLAATSELTERYPTLGDAQAAGWRQAGPFAPGLGTHFSGPDFRMNPDGDMDPEDLQVPMLVFDGLDADAPLAGFMYMAYGTEGEPEGFAGPNDHWHFHERVCIVRGADGSITTPLGADVEDVTAEMCEDVGGTFVEFTGYMVHVWNVPGYESPDGMFTELNRKITCPDGTYHRIPNDEIGDRDTVCRNP
jgi:hypothetical protein